MATVAAVRGNDQWQRQFVENELSSMKRGTKQEAKLGKKTLTGVEE